MISKRTHCFISYSPIQFVASSDLHFKLHTHIREPVLAVWFASKVQTLYNAFYTGLYKNTIKVKGEEYSGSIMLLVVSTPIMCWFSVFDVTCGDLWDLQFIARKGTKLLPVSYKDSSEQRVTCVSIVCLSISSDHILEQNFPWRFSESHKAGYFSLNSWVLSRNPLAFFTELSKTWY